MKDNRDVPQSDYSVEEILAEAKIQNERESRQKPVSGNSGAETPEPRHGAFSGADEIARRARTALNMEAGSEETGGEGPAASGTEEAAPPAPKKEKRHFWFRRRKKKEEEAVPEDDIYYGLQLKSLDEYRRAYEATLQLDRAELEAAAKKARAKHRELAEKTEKQNAEAAKAPAAAKNRPAEKPPETAQKEAEAKPESAKISAAAENRSTDAPASKASPRSAESVGEDRRDRLEKIMEHVGLDAGEIFGGAEASPRPKLPQNPPRPSIPIPTEPPVPPAVEPGPAMEPEIRPPIVEPPSGPGRVPERVPTAGAFSQDGGKPELSGKAEPPRETERAEAARSTPDETGGTPAPVKEPGAAPHAKKEETPPPPPAGEPNVRHVPKYRADSLPLHIIELNAFGDALAAEAAGYSPPPHTPEPIPFPASERPDEPAGPSAPEERVPGETDAEPENPEAAVPGGGKPGPGAEPIPFPAQESPPPKAKKRFRLFGSDEDVGETAEEPDGAEEELDDYSAPADAPSILHDLSSGVRKLILRFAVTGICAVILVAFSAAWEYPSVLPPALHNRYGPQSCLAVHLIFLLIATAFCAPAVWNGIRGLFRFQANSDSAVSLAAAAALLENVVLLFTGFPADCRLYSALAACALFLNTAGKLSMAKRILRSFRFVSSPEQKYAVQMFGDYNTAIQLAGDSGIGEPRIAYQTKTGFLEHFLKHSYRTDPSDHTAPYLAPVGFIGSLALCIVTAVLTKNPVTAVSAFAASACVCAPFANMLSVNLPLAKLGKIASRCGGMTVGWDAVEQFSETNAVLLDAEDLFPRGTVVLNGIRTFAGQRIDEAILDATALTKAAGGPLSDLFSQIVKSRGDILPHVENPCYEDGAGISGTVSSRVILVGNAALLKKHGIDAPSRDYEEKYIRGGKFPVYLASGGIPVAMFLVSYRSDRRRAAELRRLEYNGIGLLVRTRDPNITPELVAGCFGLSRHSVRVLPERLGSVCQSLWSGPPERSPAVLATKGRATAMMRMVTACVRQRSNIIVGVALQTAGAALGFALVAFFAACSGLGRLTATALLLFEAFWTAAVLFIPRIRRP